MELKRKIAMYSGIIILLLIPTCLFLYNKFVDKPNELVNALNTNGNSIVLIVDSNCNTCGEVKEILAKYKVDYYELNVDDNNYETIIRRLDLDGRYVKAPSLVTVVDGETFSYLLDIKVKEDLVSFIENYNLGSD